MKLCELLLHLEVRAGCLISVEPMCPQLLNCDRFRLPTRMTLHNHDFCRFIKRYDGNRSCADNKHRSMRIAERGRRFFGCCPYGMWELVQPVMFQRRLAAILYLGGFCDPAKLPPLQRYGIYHGSLPPAITPAKIALLKEYAMFAAMLIRLELELEYASGRPAPVKQHGTDYYLDKVSAFLAQRFSENISLEDAATVCRLTPNYLSNLLRRHTGKTFRQLLTEQRLIEAEVCLKYREALSMTEIALQCGFCDGNYFSAVFRQSFGCSPRQYRRDWKSLRSAGNLTGDG